MHGLKKLARTVWHTREVHLLAPFALTTSLFVIFIRLADEMLEGETHGFDTAILLAFRTSDPTDPIGPLWMEAMVADLTSLGGYTVLILISLIAIGYLLIRRQKAAALLVALSGLSGMGLNHLLKVGFDRPRPTLVSHLAEVQTLSFPSGHAMLSAIIYLTLGALLARSQDSYAIKVYSVGIALAVTILIGLSRIYLGVHWPTDVLGGWCIGAAWALICLQILTWMQSRT